MTIQDQLFLESAARAVRVVTKRWPQGLIVVDDPLGICSGALMFTPLERQSQAERMAAYLGLVDKSCPHARLDRFAELHTAGLVADLTPSVAWRRAVVQIASETVE